MATKMNTNPPLGSGPLALQPNLHGGPQQFLADEGCAQFATGQNYQIQET